MICAITLPAASQNVPVETDVVSTLANEAPTAAAPLGKIDIKTPAQEFIKKVPKDFLLSTKPSARVGPQNPGGGTVVLEEIQVIGKFDPADYIAPKASPMLVFRATLDQQRPMTPKEVSQLVLGYLGLFREFGANGRAITDLSPEERAEDRLNTPFTPRFGRGTLQ